MSNESNCCSGPGYASPHEAIKAPKENIVYTVCIYTGTNINKPDYLATIDVDKNRTNYGKVIHSTELGTSGDEYIIWGGTYARLAMMMKI